MHHVVHTPGVLGRPAIHAGAQTPARGRVRSCQPPPCRLPPARSPCTSASRAGQLRTSLPHCPLPHQLLNAASGHPAALHACDTTPQRSITDLSADRGGARCWSRCSGGAPGAPSRISHGDSSPRAPPPPPFLKNAVTSRSRAPRPSSQPRARGGHFQNRAGDRGAGPDPAGRPSPRASGRPPPASPWEMGWWARGRGRAGGGGSAWAAPRPEPREEPRGLAEGRGGSRRRQERFPSLPVKLSRPYSLSPVSLPGCLE